MNRQELETFIQDKYGIEIERPWMSKPGYEVFRHSENQKWFAVILDVPMNKLGLKGFETIDVVNLKCDPLYIELLRSEPGYLPAYHMNKRNWITVLLDGTVPDERILSLLEMSFELTS